MGVTCPKLFLHASAAAVAGAGTAETAAVITVGRVTCGKVETGGAQEGNSVSDCRKECVQGAGDTHGPGVASGRGKVVEVVSGWGEVVKFQGVTGDVVEKHEGRGEIIDVAGDRKLVEFTGGTGDVEVDQGRGEIINVTDGRRDRVESPGGRPSAISSSSSSPVLSHAA